MPELFIVRAAAAGIGVALLGGVLGCFVVWRRLAYFGDSLAHSALLGIALGVLLGIGDTLGVMASCSLFALALVWLLQKEPVAADALLGILAHTALSFGLVAMSLLNAPPFDLHRYLFGDILAVNTGEILWIYGGGIGIFILLWANWQSLILMTVNEELAKAEGVKTFYGNALLMLLMTVAVAVSIQIVGILLITAMLIIPAAAARMLSRSPEGMAAVASLLGVVAVIGGMWLSYQLDTPSGPSIISVAAVLFAVIAVLSPLWGKE